VSHPVTRGAGGSPAQCCRRQDVQASRLHHGSTGVPEYDLISGLESSSAHQIKQRGHCLAGVDWIEQQSFELRGALQAIDHLVGRYPITRANRLIGKFQPIAGRFPLPAEQSHYLPRQLSRECFPVARRAHDGSGYDRDFLASKCESSQDARDRSGAADRHDQGINANLILPDLIQQLEDCADVARSAVWS